jgi:hypothetical protein
VHIEFVNLDLLVTGNNRRPQGRRGGYRGPRRDSKPKEFEDEYDFESANAKFKKEEVEEEWHKKLNLVLTLNDEVIFAL